MAVSQVRRLDPDQGGGASRFRNACTASATEATVELHGATFRGRDLHEGGGVGDAHGPAVVPRRVPDAQLCVRACVRVRARAPDSRRIDCDAGRARKRATAPQRHGGAPQAPPGRHGGRCSLPCVNGGGGAASGPRYCGWRGRPFDGAAGAAGAAHYTRACVGCPCTATVKLILESSVVRAPGVTARHPRGLHRRA